MPFLQLLPQVLLRTKHMPFTARRDYMKTRVEEYQKASEKTLQEELPMKEIAKESHAE